MSLRFGDAFESHEENRLLDSALASEGHETCLRVFQEISEFHAPCPKDKKPKATEPGNLLPGLPLASA